MFFRQVPLEKLRRRQKTIVPSVNQTKTITRLRAPPLTTVRAMGDYRGAVGRIRGERKSLPAHDLRYRMNYQVCTRIGHESRFFLGAYLTTGTRPIKEYKIMLKSFSPLRVLGKLLAMSYLLIVGCSEPTGSVSHIHKFYLSTQLNSYVIAPDTISESLEDARNGLSQFSSLSPKLDKPYFIVSYDGAPQLSLADYHQLVIGPMSKRNARRLCATFLSIEGDEGYTRDEQDEICELSTAKEFLSARSEFKSAGATIRLRDLIFKDVTVSYRSFISESVAIAPNDARGQDQPLPTAPAQPAKNKRETDQVKTMTIAGRDYTFPISGHVFSRTIVGDVNSMFCADATSDYFQLFKRSDMVESCELRFRDAYARCVSLASQDSNGRKWKSDVIDSLDEALTNVTMLSECVLIQNLVNQFRLPDQKRDVPVDEVVAKIHKEAPKLLAKID